MRITSKDIRDEMPKDEFNRLLEKAVRGMWAFDLIGIAGICEIVAGESNDDIYQEWKDRNV